MKELEDIRQRLTRLEVTQQYAADELKAVRQDVSAVSDNVSMMKEDLHTTLGDIRDKVVKNDQDIKWLKTWLWKSFAGATAVAAVASKAISKLIP